MQSSNDGWGAFDLDNTAYWLYRIPFCDFGAIIDPPSVDVTAHCVELLAREPGYERAVARGLEYLFEKQEDDGSWFGRWGVNYIYGTGATLPALEAAGVPPEPPGGPARRRVARVRPERGRRLRRGLPLVRRRGGGPRLARTGRVDGVADGVGAHGPRGRGRGEVGGRRHELRRGSPTHQRDDGDWDEEHFTGTGFPRDFLIRYHLYRIVWPVIALARYTRALR